MLMMFHAYTHIHIHAVHYINLANYIHCIAWHYITLHYSTLHYIILYHILLYCITLYHIILQTQNTHWYPRVCAQVNVCMYVHFFDGARQSHDRMSGFPERHVFLFQSVMSSSSECSAASPQHRVRRARYEERTERLAQSGRSFFTLNGFSRTMLACAL